MHTLVDRATGIGYVALSLGMIAGAVWGEQAWGEYWTWSIKEAWTLLTWLVCIFYFHVCHRRGWRGPPAMSVAVLSLVAVMVTFFLTPTLLHWTRLKPLRIY
jgi:ABC-type transport system involved in cytochrome c biogenesis permease subunit